MSNSKNIRGFFFNEDQVKKVKKNLHKKVNEKNEHEKKSEHVN